MLQSPCTPILAERISDLPTAMLHGLEPCARGTVLIVRLQVWPGQQTARGRALVDKLEGFTRNVRPGSGRLVQLIRVLKFRYPILNLVVGRLVENSNNRFLVVAPSQLESVFLLTEFRPL
jgi:hypothetical protein